MQIIVRVPPNDFGQSMAESIINALVKTHGALVETEWREAPCGSLILRVILVREASRKEISIVRGAPDHQDQDFMRISELTNLPGYKKLLRLRAFPCGNGLSVEVNVHRSRLASPASSSVAKRATDADIRQDLFKASLIIAGHIANGNCLTPRTARRKRSNNSSCYSAN
jgi:hypothetical protein